MKTDPNAIRPLRTWCGVVSQDWVDYNGHLRDAYYLLVFSLATDVLMNHIGLDEAGRQTTGHSLFTMECHLNFLQEVKADAAVEVYTRILGFDKKRLHIFQSLHLQDEEPPLAVNEQLLLNVAMAGPKAAAFDESVFSHIERLAKQHASLPKPEIMGRVICLPGQS